MKDFFISYTGADKLWADGLAQWLIESGFTCTLQSLDFVAGSNFVIEMHEAVKACKRLILVLSPDYLAAKFPQAEWSAALAKDPTGAGSTLVGVRVRDCHPDGLLKPIVYIDLVGLSFDQARGKFISEIMSARRRMRKASTARPASSPCEKPGSASITQTATGRHITQVGGDYHHYDSPPKQVNVITPQPGAISPAQRQRVKRWIEALVENTVGKTRDEAFGMWWERFYNRFNVNAYAELSAKDLPDVSLWYRQQMAILTTKLRRPLPDSWRSARIRSIKSGMTRLGFDDSNKAEYYQALAVRLKLKKSFTSLKELTKQDLERVYGAVLRDVRDAGR